MNEYELKMKKFLMENNIEGEHLIFEQSCHSVEEAANTVKALPEDLVKSICMIDGQGKLIVAVVRGEDRASTTRVGKVLGIEPPRIATPEEILEKTGYICGGTPCFGYDAIFLIDPKVMERQYVYTGGGSENSLVKIPTKELERISGGQIVRVRR